MIFESASVFMSKVMFFTGFVKDSEAHGFPKPLSKDEEAKLLLIKDTDKNARDKLITHNLRLVSHIVKKYSGAEDADDLISVGSIGLIKAIDSFNSSKGTLLSTYASRCIENEILMLLRSNKKHMRTQSLEEALICDKDGNEVTLMDIIPESEEKQTDNVVNAQILTDDIDKMMKQVLDEREYQVISYRYGLNNKPALPQREVALILGLSRSYISRIEKKALELLKDEAIKIGLYL